MMGYKVTSLGKVKEITGNYGTLKIYDIELEGAGWVELSQKPETPAPTVGQELEGTVEDTKYGKRFKKAQKAAGGFTGGRQDSPEQRGSIERQTALKAAVEATRDSYTVTSMPEALKTAEQYTDAVIMTAKKFAAFLHNANPQTTVKSTAEVQLDLPPLDSYGDMQ